MMFQFALALILLNAFVAQANEEGSSLTCSTHGLANFRSFRSDRLDSCCNVATKVLIQNQWLKVSQHTFFTETFEYDWESSKIFIEFYGDIPNVPIFYLSSDILSKDCVNDCQLSEDSLIKSGVGKVASIIIKKDSDSKVAYIRYEKANVTMYIRRGIKSLNFGIYAPSYMSHTSSGKCVTSCIVSFEEKKCFSKENMSKLREVCRILFTDMKTDDYVDNLITACAQDMFVFKDVLVGLDSRYALIDELMIEDFDTISSRYIYGKIDKVQLEQYKNAINETVCDDFKMPPSF